MLLGADDHSGSHETHVGDHLVCCEAVAVNQVCADQATCPAEPSFAVDGDVLVLDSDGLVREVNEFPHEVERRAGSVVEDHVNVSYSKGGKVLGGVQVRV